MTTTGANRRYPSLPGAGGTMESHTRLLELLKQAVEIHERRTPNAILDSFVRLREIVDLGFAKIRGSEIIAVVQAGDGSSGGTVAAEDVTYNNAISGLTATDVQAAIDELKLLIVGSTPVAGDVPYDNSYSDLYATDVQAAIDELEAIIRLEGYPAELGYAGVW